MSSRTASSCCTRAAALLSAVSRPTPGGTKAGGSRSAWLALRQDRCGVTSMGVGTAMRLREAAPPSPVWARSLGSYAQLRRSATASQASAGESFGCLRVRGTQPRILPARAASCWCMQFSDRPIGKLGRLSTELSGPDLGPHFSPLILSLSTFSFCMHFFAFSDTEI